MLGNVQGQSGLAHARATGDYDQVRRLEARCELVQVPESCGHPGDGFLSLVELLDLLETVLDEIFDRDEGGPDPLFRDLEDLPLRLVQRLSHVSRIIVSHLGDLGRRGDHQPPDRLLPHQAGIVGDVRSRGDQIRQAAQVGCAAHRLEKIVAAQMVGQRHQVHRFGPLEEGAHRLEDLAVGFPVEVVPVEDFYDLEDRFVLDQDTAQHGLLGLYVLWGNLIGIALELGHGLIP